MPVRQKVSIMPSLVSSGESQTGSELTSRDGAEPVTMREKGLPVMR